MKLARFNINKFDRIYKKMFEYMCIFTTGGVLLWSKAGYSTNFNIELINIFIKSMLLENTQSAKKQFNFQDYLLKW